MNTYCHGEDSQCVGKETSDRFSSFISGDLFVVGEGRRHFVIGCNGGVLRVQKDVNRNSEAHAIASMDFHSNFVSRYFAGFVCSQQVVTCDPGLLQKIMGVTQTNIPSPFWCISSWNLIDEYTVELKPKCVLVEHAAYPPRFVLEQHARKVIRVYDPRPIWETRDFTQFSQSLKAARDHAKHYMKVHQWSLEAPWTPEEVIFAALSSVQGKDLLHRLQRLQMYGVDRFAKKMIGLLNEAGSDESAHVSPVLGSDVDGFYDSTESSNKKIDTFLAGRMAMDVSLMFNLHSPKEGNKYPDLTPISLSNGWKCTIGVVDTDLKHRWKIPDYAKQLDCAISAFRQ